MSDPKITSYTFVVELMKYVSFTFNAWFLVVCREKILFFNDFSFNLYLHFLLVSNLPSTTSLKASVLTKSRSKQKEATSNHWLPTFT